MESEKLLTLINNEKKKFTDLDSKLRKVSQEALRKSQDEGAAKQKVLLVQIKEIKRQAEEEEKKKEEKEAALLKVNKALK